MKRYPSSRLVAEMASLLDKLRAAKPLPAQKAVSDSSLTLEQIVRMDRGAFFPLPPETITLMQGVDANETIHPEDILFFDTETTGLSGGTGTVAFLVGCGIISEEGLVVRQFLMRDYNEEIFMLREFQTLLQRAKMIVTFNGASFDVPLLQSRFTIHRMHRETIFPLHLDVLHIARRVYKTRIGRCSLTSLEKQVFGEEREGDLPGAQVPETYFKYLKTGNLAVLDPVLSHNVKDIVSLVRLLYTLASLHDNPLSAQHQEDIFSLGKVYEKRGATDTAKVCYRAVSAGPMQTPAITRLANLSMRLRQDEEAARLFEQLRVSGTAGAKVYISLSKLYEHRFGQYDKALVIAKQGMLYCLECLPLEAAKRSADYQDLSHRYQRLLRKAGGM